MTKVWITDGIFGETVEVPDDADPDKVALDWITVGYEIGEPVDGTVWLRSEVWAFDEEDERDHLIGSAVRAVDPPEPACVDKAHDWRRNPGVYAHGGGVIIHEVCRHCGIERVTDTWATDPQTGEQGLRSVSYVQR